MNTIQLIGRLTAEPDLRIANSGTPVARFRVAVPRRGEDAGADFVDVVAFNRLGEVCAEHLGKGRGARSGAPRTAAAGPVTR